MNPKAMYCDSAVGTAAAISLPGLLQSGVIPIWPEMSGYPTVQAFEQAITRRGVRKVLFLPQGDRGYRIYLSSYRAIPNFDQVPRTDPPPLT